MSRLSMAMAGALLRARLPWVGAAAVAAALYPRTLPDIGAVPGMGMALTGIVLALLLTRGAVSHDVRSGALLLWIQKPGHPVRHYAARLATLALLTAGAHLVVGTALLLPGLAPGGLSAGRVVVLLLADVTVVTLAFAVSATAVPLETVVTVLLLVALAGPGADAVLAPELYGSWAPWLASIRFPGLEHAALARWLDGTGPVPTVGAVLRVVLYPAALSALGLGVVAGRTGSLGLGFRGLSGLRRSGSVRWAGGHLRKTDPTPGKGGRASGGPPPGGAPRR